MDEQTAKKMLEQMQQMTIAIQHMSNNVGELMANVRNISQILAHQFPLPAEKRPGR